MSHRIDVYYWNHAGRQDPAVAQTLDDLARILGEIEAHPQPHPTVFVSQDRPTFGPLDMPDHQLKIDVNSAERVGAISYYGPVNDDEHTDAPGSWITHAAEATPASSPLFIDRDTRTQFPQDAVLPLDQVHRAVQEFQETGQRPTCVGWQPSEAW